MSVAEAWLGGIGEYPPHPSRLAIPPSSVGFASGHRGVLLTSQDSEGILQYLLAMPRPLYQYLTAKSLKVNKKQLKLIKTNENQ